MSDSRQGERLDALEARIAFQDRTIEELSDTIAKQWKVIDALSRKLELLEEHVRSAAPASDPRQEPPPPHY